MFIFKLFVVILGVRKAFLEQAKLQSDNPELEANYVNERLTDILVSYYGEAENRIAEMNDIRFMYEESPHYEQGYIMGEIIERYRKCFGHLKNMLTRFGDGEINMYFYLKMLELVQKHYFEIYHLVRMMHEIPQKYMSIKEFAEESRVDDRHYLQAQQHLKDLNRRLKADKKKRMKEMKLIRDRYLANAQDMERPGERKNPYNRWWPLDYGWEVYDEW